VHLPSSFKSANTVVANAKRFLANENIKRLEAQKAEPLLQELHVAVKVREVKKGQIHKLFEESFDAKQCYNQFSSGKNFPICIKILYEANGSCRKILLSTRTAAQGFIR
jgi:hypothetical protein